MRGIAVVRSRAELFQCYPLLRPLLALVAGILYFEFIGFGFFSVVLLALSLLTLLLCNRSGSLLTHLLFGPALWLFFFSAGQLLGRWEAQCGGSRLTVETGLWPRLRQQAVEQIDKARGDSQAKALLGAITLGEKRQLSRATKNSFAVAGVAHLLAISGLHVGIILTFLYSIMYGRRIVPLVMWHREGVIFVLLWCYACLTGLSPSVLRTVFMLSLWQISRLVDRDHNALNALFVSAFCLLLYRPSYLFSVSFQLSYSALLGILLLLPSLNRRLGSWPLVPRYVVGLLATSMAAQLAVAPLVLYYFQTFPTYFLLTNLLLLPFIGLLLALTFVGLLTSFVPPLSLLILNGAMVLASWFIRLTEWVSSLPAAQIVPFGS